MRSTIAAAVLGAFAFLGIVSPSVAGPASDWNSAYVGLQGGGGSGATQWTRPSNSGTTGNFGGTGNLFGATLGKNWVAGRVVFGLESDFSAANINAVAPAGVGCTTCTTTLDWFATLRARAGLLVLPQALLFASGGWGVGGFTQSYLSAPSSTTATGWTVGGGLELAVSSRWTLKAEYLYSDFGSQVACPVGSACGGGSVVNADYFRTQAVQVGLNWHLP